MPTLKEQGIDGVDVQQWYGVFAPAHTPGEIVAALNRALEQSLADKDVVRRLADHGADAKSSTPAEFGELVKADLAKWRGVVQRAQIRAD